MKQPATYPVDVSRETWTDVLDGIQNRSCAFDDYAESLLTWNRRVNLVSRDMTTGELAKHIRHCLMIAVLPAFQQSTRFVDVGTGGGLPGIPLAMAYPDKRFRLVDVVEKKCLVLKELARSLLLRNVDVECVDIRNLTVQEDEVVLSKHAFKLPDIATNLAMQDWRQALILKGADYRNELNEVSEPWHVGVLDLGVLDTDAFYTDKMLLHILRL